MLVGLETYARGKTALSSDRRSLYFLSCFAKLRKATISFVMSVCPSVRMEQLGSRWTDFHKICYLNLFGKFVEKVKVSLKSDKKNG